MGFLSGVLESVKNENEVTTYDNYISEPNKRLEDVISTLSKNIGSGRTGLVESVEQVKRWLEGYNSKVETLTTAVTTKLGTLSSNLSSSAGQYYTEVTSQQNASLATQLGEWTKTVKKIEKDVETIKTNANVLDTKLRDNVMHEMKVVEKGVKMLRDSAAVPGLREQVSRVDAELDARRDKLEAIIIRKSDSILLKLVEQRQTILEKINHESESLGIKINDEWQNIAKEVNTLDDVQHDMFKKINDAVRKTKEDAFSLVGDYTGTYKKPTIKHFTNIIGEMPDINATNKFAGAVEGNSKLYQDVKRIQTGIDEMEKQLQVGAGKIGGAIDTAVKALSTALTALDEKLQRDVEGLKQKITPKIVNAINELKEGIGQAATEDGRQGVNYFIQALKNSRLKSLPQLKAWITAADETQLENALGGFFFGMFKTNIQDLLNITANVNSLGSKQSKLLDAITKDLQDKVNEKINDIKDRSKFNANMPEYYNWVNTNSSEGNRTLFYSIGDVKNNIKEYFTGNIDNNAGFDFAKLGDYIRKKKIATRTVSEVLHRITKLQALHKSVYDKRDATDQLMVKLEEALNAIKADVESIESTVVEASNALERSIGVVHHALIRTEQVTREAISEVSNRVANAVKEAFAEVESTVDSYRDNLLEQLESSFSTLTSAVRTLFAEQKKADLQALKGVVEEQKKVIERIIDEDKRTGIKGLLKAVSGMKFTVDNAKTPAFEDTAELLDAINNLAPSLTPTAEKFKQLSEKFYAYYNNVDTYIKDQVTAPPTPPPTPPPTDPASKLTKIKDDFDNLLTHLSDASGTKKYNYDHQFTQLLTNLSTSLTSLQPSHFANPRHPELLDAVKKGLQGFVEQMERVYVNGYDDGNKINWDTNRLVEQKSDSKNSGEKEKLTPYGEKLSKICLTILDVVNRDIDVLRVKCPASGNREGHKIISSNSIGKWFQGLGYKVSDSDTKQHGELVNKIKDGGIKSLCETPINGLNKDVLEVLRRQQFSRDGKTTTLYQLLNHLYDRLDKYRRVCHLRHISRPQAPTTVNQMLHWLSGLYWNSMYEKLKGYLQTWFREYAAEYGLAHDNFEVAVPARYGWNMIQKVSIGFLEDLFNNVTVRSPIILTTIVGHGQADGRYACDFYTNPDDLLYPSSPASCFDMFVDICLRLNEQLRFLYAQCHNGPDSSGWRDCWYGRDVGGSAWKCNKLQCAGQIGVQKHNQNCDQNCGQSAECGLKSPLQSFLEDGLPGFLPHQFGGPGCKLTCTSANHFGKPCKTPMGFRDLSVTASHRQKGQQIKTVLDPFSGPVPDSLTLLCGYFQCLLRRPPQTLCDMYSFYYNYLENWEGADGSDPVKVQQHKQKAFDEAVKKANFWNEQTRLEITSIQQSSKHSGNIHDQGDLFGLLSCNPKATPSLPCGQYLQPLNMDTRNLFSEKQAGLYLSWVVYITETFYDLLKRLRDECCKTCNKPGAKCCGKKCANECTVKSTEQTQPGELSATGQHLADCKSIMNCPDTHPNLYKYGFTFGSPYKLSGESNDQKQKRTCQDFCEALNKVVKDGSVLYDLVHKHIPKFLWAIREKFFWTTVALWSASFLYLIYVMVGRLDLLHIKSHLHSPSSHRIAAQSLLAAGRVNKLNRVFYLQP